jgi:hypothetical protein
MTDRITSYNTLVQAVLDIAEDNGTELQEYLPVAIDNAELRVMREIDTLDQIYTSTVTVNASTARITKPAGHLITKYITIFDPSTGRKTVLRKKTDSYLDEYWPHETSVGTPKYYSDEDRTTFKIAPCASAATSVKIVGFRRPPALTPSNQTNVLVSTVPNILFYATMVEVGIWQRNDRITKSFAEQYMAARDAINNEGRRQRRDDGSVVANPNAGENTLGTSQNQ